MPYLGKTAKGIAQFTSIFAGMFLLAWAFFCLRRHSRVASRKRIQRHVLLRGRSIGYIVFAHGRLEAMEGVSPKVTLKLPLLQLKVATRSSTRLWGYFRQAQEA